MSCPNCAPNPYRTNAREEAAEKQKNNSSFHWALKAVFLLLTITIFVFGIVYVGAAINAQSQKFETNRRKEVLALLSKCGTYSIKTKEFKLKYDMKVLKWNDSMFYVGSNNGTQCKLNDLRLSDFIPKVVIGANEK